MSLRDTFPGFMGSRDDETRTAFLRDGELSTMVVEGDWITGARKDELFAGGNAFAPTHGNEIEYFRDARRVFRKMADEIAAAGPGDSIILLGWAFGIHTELLPDTPEGAILGANEAWRRPGRAGRMLADAARRGATVFVILWAGSPNASQLFNVAGVDQANEHPLVKQALEAESPNLHVVLDRADHDIGAHHLKLLLVQRGSRGVAFYGGLDIHTSRYERGGFHDLHARVRGPAVRQLFDLAVTRFETSMPTIAERAAFSVISPPDAPPLPGGTSHARLTRTLMYRSRGDYDPSTDIEPLLRTIVARATRFLYVEDQYLWTLLGAVEHGMMDAIAERLSHLHHVTFVTNDDPEQSNEHIANRHAALRRLYRRAGPLQYKIGVFCYPGRFVHPKLWIADDEIAVCGSANFAPRSYKYDTELMVAEVDRVGQPWHALGATHARRLRMSQWGHLLGMRAGERLSDGVAAGAYFRRIETMGEHRARLAGARIADYTILGVPWRTAAREGLGAEQTLEDRGANG